MVEIEVDPGNRGDAVGGAAAGIAAGAAGGVAVVVVGGSAPFVLTAAAGIGLAGGVGAVAASWAGRLHRRKLRDVLGEVDGVLDQLEQGETIEPPPPSWRQWVRRHFHGVAREMFMVRDE